MRRLPNQAQGVGDFGGYLILAGLVGLSALWQTPGDFFGFNASFPRAGACPSGWDGRSSRGTKAPGTAPVWADATPRPKGTSLEDIARPGTRRALVRRHDRAQCTVRFFALGGLGAAAPAGRPPFRVVPRSDAGCGGAERTSGGIGAGSSDRFRVVTRHDESTAGLPSFHGGARGVRSAVRTGSPISRRVWGWFFGGPNSAAGRTRNQRDWTWSGAVFTKGVRPVEECPVYFVRAFLGDAKHQSPTLLLVNCQETACRMHAPRVCSG